MATALSTLRGYIRLNIEETSAGYWTDAVLNRYINQAIRHINRKTVYLVSATPSTISLVAGTRTYAMPTNCPSAERIAYMCTDEGKPIPPIGLKGMKDTDGVDLVDGDTTDYPMYWYRSGIQIAFYPIPNAVKTVYVWFLQTPTTLSLDADTTPFPNEYDDLVEYRVSWQCYAEHEGPASPKAQNWKALYDEALDDVNRLLSVFLMGNRQTLNSYPYWPFLEAKTGSR